MTTDDELRDLAEQCRYYNPANVESDTSIADDVIDVFPAIAAELIEARALIERLRERQADLELRLDTEPPFNLDSVIDARRWIPVGERLPEEKGRYLFAAKSTVSDRCLISIEYYEPGWGTAALFTHWMPLPQPPQEGDL